MDRATTGPAFHAVAAGKAIAGEVALGRGQHRARVPPGRAAARTARPSCSAWTRRPRAKSGVALAGPQTATFKVVPKPAAAARARPNLRRSRRAPSPSPKPPSGGGGAVSGNWAGVESYYLRLMNCTRTGGWVTSGGKCSSPGGRAVAPLKLSAGISSRVSRPYAKLLATRNICNHFIGGTPGDRLRSKGYTSYRWGENLGCRSGNPFSAVLGSHLFFQTRAAVQRRPLSQPDGRALPPGRHRRVGLGRPRPPRDRLLHALTVARPAHPPGGTIGRVTRRTARATIGA